MKAKAQKVTATLMALVLAGALSPSLAYAATNVTVGKADFTTSTSTIVKKAKAVKVGASKVTFKKGKGYLKFKAAKSKVYSFTFSGLKSSASYPSAFVEVMKPYADYPTSSGMVKVSTKGGKTTTLWLGMNGYTSNYGDKVNQCLKSRTGKIKLKKNEQLFMYFSGGDAKATASLKIK